MSRLSTRTRSGRGAKAQAAAEVDGSNATEEIDLLSVQGKARRRRKGRDPYEAVDAEEAEAHREVKSAAADEDDAGGNKKQKVY